MHLFMSSFEVLHPYCLGPILFASCELQTQTLENLLVHGLCCSSNTKTQLAKWSRVHFPYNRGRGRVRGSGEAETSSRGWSLRSGEAELHVVPEAELGG
jgi:hypothetical protein